MTKEQKNEYQREWRKKNPEKGREYSRTAYARHATQLKEKRRIYVRDHRELVRAQNAVGWAKWIEAHPEYREKARVKAAAWVRSNKARHAATSRAWYEKNRERVAKYQREYRKKNRAAKARNAKKSRVQRSKTKQLLTTYEIRTAIANSLGA